MDFWGVVGSIFWFMILFAWIGLLFRIFGDLFGDHELSGWSKALWTVFLIFFPWLGALVYLVARGRSMNERALAQARRNEQAIRQYVRETAGAGNEYRRRARQARRTPDQGAISDEEFQHAKAKLLGRQPETVSRRTPTGARPPPRGEPGTATAGIRAPTRARRRARTEPPKPESHGLPAGSAPDGRTSGNSPMLESDGRARRHRRRPCPPALAALVAGNSHPRPDPPRLQPGDAGVQGEAFSPRNQAQAESPGADGAAPTWPADRAPARASRARGGAS